MNRFFVLVLLLSPCVFGQVRPTKSKALLACEAASADREKSYSAAVQERDEALAKVKQLEARNAEVLKRLDDATVLLKILSEEVAGRELGATLQARLAQIPSGEIFDLGVSIEQDHNKLKQVAIQLLEHDSMAVDKYNALLADYKDYVSHVSVQLGQANRSNAALLGYQLLNRYSPPQTINLHVTDCTKFPALCVGK